MSLEWNQEDDQRERELVNHRRPAAEVGWVLLLLDGLLLGASSLYWVLRGRFFDRGFYEALGQEAGFSRVSENATGAAIRLAGFLGVLASALFIAMAASSYRRGERWAWYVAWSLPVLAVLDFGLVAGYSAVTLTSITWELGLAGLAALSLSLSYRSFFGRARPA